MVLYDKAEDASLGSQELDDLLKQAWNNGLGNIDEERSDAKKANKISRAKQRELARKVGMTVDPEGSSQGNILTDIEIFQ